MFYRESCDCPPCFQMRVTCANIRQIMRNVLTQRRLRALFLAAALAPIACAPEAGEQGPQGEQGEQGPKGPKGSMGPPAPDVERYTVQLETLSEGGSAEAIAVCDEGDLLVTGSCQFGKDESQVMRIFFIGAWDDAWRCAAWLPGENPSYITATAVCAAQ